MINREEFEMLPKIMAHLHNVSFVDDCNKYTPLKMGYIIHEFSAYYLNGAWNMYQEMHKKVVGSEEKPRDKESVMNKAVDMARNYGTAFVQLKINTANEIEYKNIDYGNVILRKTED